MGHNSRIRSTGIFARQGLITSLVEPSLAGLPDSSGLCRIARPGPPLWPRRDWMSASADGWSTMEMPMKRFPGQEDCHAVGVDLAARRAGRRHSGMRNLSEPMTCRRLPLPGWTTTAARRHPRALCRSGRGTQSRGWNHRNIESTQRMRFTPSASSPTRPRRPSTGNPALGSGRSASCGRSPAGAALWHAGRERGRGPS